MYVHILTPVSPQSTDQNINQHKATTAALELGRSAFSLIYSQWPPTLYYTHSIPFAAPNDSYTLSELITHSYTALNDLYALTELTAVAGFVREVAAVVVPVADPALVKTDAVGACELTGGTCPGWTALHLILTVQAVARAITNKGLGDAGVVARSMVRLTAEWIRRTRAVSWQEMG